MKVGNWGTALKFVVSDDTVRTFQEMTHSASVRLSEHQVINGKPRVQFQGPALGSAKFTMELMAPWCKHPAQVEARLIEAMNDGYHAPLVVGGRRILGDAIMKSISASYDKVIARGRISSLKLDVEMSEYR